MRELKVNCLLENVKFYLMENGFGKKFKNSFLKM